MARSLAKATRGKLSLRATEKAYLAGVIDSDGCISISKMKARTHGATNARYVLTINVVNTSETLMRWLVERFGGRYKVRRRASEKHRATFDWWFNNAKAADLLKTIERHLLVKGEQAAVGIELIRGWRTNHGRGATTSPDEVERRERLYLRMRGLNRTGPYSRND